MMMSWISTTESGDPILMIWTLGFREVRTQKILVRWNLTRRESTIYLLTLLVVPGQEQKDIWEFLFVRIPWDGPLMLAPVINSTVASATSRPKDPRQVFLPSPTIPRATVVLVEKDSKESNVLQQQLRPMVPTAQAAIAFLPFQVHSWLLFLKRGWSIRSRTFG